MQCWVEWREFAWDSKARRVAFTMFSSCTLRKAMNQWVAWTMHKQQSAIKARTAVQVRPRRHCLAWAACAGCRVAACPPHAWHQGMHSSAGGALPYKSALQGLQAAAPLPCTACRPVTLLPLQPEPYFCVSQ